MKQVTVSRNLFMFYLAVIVMVAFWNLRTNLKFLQVEATQRETIELQTETIQQQNAMLARSNSSMVTGNDVMKESSAALQTAMDAMEDQRLALEACVARLPGLHFKYTDEISAAVMRGGVEVVPNADGVYEIELGIVHVEGGGPTSVPPIGGPGF